MYSLGWMEPIMGLPVGGSWAEEEGRAGEKEGRRKRRKERGRRKRRASYCVRVCVCVRVCTCAMDACVCASFIPYYQQ